MGYITKKDGVTIVLQPILKCQRPSTILLFQKWVETAFVDMVFHHLLTVTWSSDENDISAY